MRIAGLVAIVGVGALALPVMGSGSLSQDTLQRRVAKLEAKVGLLQKQMQAIRGVDRLQATLDLSLNRRVSDLENRRPIVTTGVSSSAILTPRSFRSVFARCLTGTLVGGTFHSSLSSLTPVETNVDPASGLWKVTAYNEAQSQNGSLSATAVCLSFG